MPHYGIEGARSILERREPVFKGGDDTARPTGCGLGSSSTSLLRDLRDARDRRRVTDRLGCGGNRLRGLRFKAFTE